MKITKKHKGIYASIIKNGKILLIKKARGPYTGLYDLPGGKPEMGETEEETLIREVKEETNCDLLNFSNRREKIIIFSDFTKESQEKGVLEHTGILFDCSVSGEPSINGDNLDSNGALWIKTSNLNSSNATPFAMLCCK